MKYTTRINFSQLMQVVNADSEEEAKQLIVNMLENGDIDLSMIDYVVEIEEEVEAVDLSDLYLETCNNLDD